LATKGIPLPSPPASRICLEEMALYTIFAKRILKQTVPNNPRLKSYVLPVLAVWKKPRLKSCVLVLPKLVNTSRSDRLEESEAKFSCIRTSDSRQGVCPENITDGTKMMGLVVEGGGWSRV
jgi:hypothetical protein